MDEEELEEANNKNECITEYSNGTCQDGTPRGNYKNTTQYMTQSQSSGVDHMWLSACISLHSIRPQATAAVTVEDFSSTKTYPVPISR